MKTLRLTSYSHGGGCACKVGPADLASVMGRLAPPGVTDEALLVGTATGDDAAVYRLGDHSALVVTTDFFTPIVDDAYDWGRIAAANAMSDVYAMGGRPVLCLNLVGWPVDDLPLEELTRVLDGGASVANAAGAMVVGGHTIDDREPKYGMAVVGFADPDRLMRNDAARPGDALFLTKPIGTGVVSTAIKRGEASQDAIAIAVRVMTALNAAASEAALAVGVRAATDVTGFGLLGHLHRMAAASAASARIDASAVPLLADAIPLAAAGVIPGGTRRNLAYVEPWTATDEDVDPVTRVLLADAQTSGGLLVACPEPATDGLLRAFAARGVSAARVGEVEDGTPGAIRVVP